MRWLVLGWCLAGVLGRLPPQFEREFYCPKDFCIQDTRIDHGPGWSGPGAMAYECCNVSNAHADRANVINWGEGCGPELKEQLIADGYHMNACEENSDCANVLRTETAHPRLQIQNPLGAMMATLQRLDQWLSGPTRSF